MSAKTPVRVTLLPVTTVHSRDHDNDAIKPLSIDDNDIESNENPTEIIKPKNLNPSNSLYSVYSIKRGWYPFIQSNGISKSMFTGPKYFFPIIRKVVVIGACFLLLFIVFFTKDIYYNNFVNLSTTNYMNSDNTRTYRLTFIGDSLIHRPFQEFDLGGRLQRQFNTINLNITDHAVSSQIISECNSNIANDVPVGSADMVILFWDSDISNFDESTMTAEEVRLKREYYRGNLTEVIKSVKGAGVDHMAVAGPGLLGESRLISKAISFLNVDKNQVLDDYRGINMAVSKELGVDYIDMRKSFWDSLPRVWILPAYYITLDGEHPNNRGTSLEVDEFAHTISKWTGGHLR